MRISGSCQLHSIDTDLCTLWSVEQQHPAIELEADVEMTNNVTSLICMQSTPAISLTVMLVLYCTISVLVRPPKTLVNMEAANAPTAETSELVDRMASCQCGSFV